ncbi:MAG: M4 family metallopeptidase [Psychroserpens sp.]|uniref:M4 family metallopeptidase n=1 Tax=Psychroserpens sp. TaxID=2020870 RepID=UPI0030038EB1
MKNNYLILMLSLLHGVICAQGTDTEAKHFNWITFENESAERLIFEDKSKLGLGERDALELQSQEVDNLMIEHTRYTQTNNAVAVDGSQYMMHSSSDKLWGNGRLVYGITASEIPSISEEEALQNAMVFLGAPKYYWEDESQEDFIKWLKDDPEATFFPTGALVFADEAFSQDGENYQLYWKFDIYAHGEKLREYVYVNAMDGSIGHSSDAICYSSAEGTANTYYYGEQTIITDFIGPNEYRLLDETRGGGICTLNLNLTPPSYEAGTQIEDADNNWNSPDKAGPTAHWCTEMTYDFYLDRYNRNSFDDNGAKMLTYVHFGIEHPVTNEPTCIPGGFFSGLYIAIGDGPGCGNPGYYLEHVGHEYTHGVTATTSALQGGARAGELNESFSNIMGTAIEFYADPDFATWEFKATVPYDMSNPNGSPPPFQKPDTYLGTYWVEVNDPGYDVHINGAVQDYWYYLLSEGDSGTNDNGDVYDVVSIGIDKATDIVYRNLTLYMTGTSNFIDARQGSIQAAIDLYGECSNEVVQVINAWYAVGLGSETYSNDLSLEQIVSPVNDCGLTNNEIVEVEFKYHATGCNGVIDVGTEVEFTYQIDSEPSISETWIVDEALVEGETYLYSFAEPINLPAVGETINLSAWMDYAADGNSFNDQLLDIEIGLKQALTESEITFEDGSDPETFYYVRRGGNALAEITTTAANTGSKGFSMSSGVSSPGAIPTDATLNFESQKDRISEICFCVDAQEWDYVTVNFDLKQTHSMLSNHFWGENSTELTSGMRMLVNGAQFGENFHPETYVDDSFLTHLISLDQLNLAGSTFEFCFQSRNYVNDVGDNSPFFPYDSDGDNTYLDNILFTNIETLGLNEIETWQFKMYPNPAKHQFTIALNSGIELEGINIYDILGRYVTSTTQKIVDTSSFSSGIYFVEVITNKGKSTKKLVIE